MLERRSVWPLQVRDLAIFRTATPFRAPIAHDSEAVWGVADSGCRRRVARLVCIVLYCVLRMTHELGISGSPNESHRASEGLVLLSANGLVLHANRAAVAMIGGDHHVVIGRPIHELFAKDSSFDK